MSFFKRKLWLLCLLAGDVNAAQVDLVLLSRDKVILSVDGERRTLAVGERSPEGVKLISIGAESAMLEIDGKRKSYTVGKTGSVSTRFEKPQTTEIQIQADAMGMYQVRGSINGSAAQFLVDTGATLVTLSGSHARRMGIDYRNSAQRIPMATASGNTVGYLIRLDRVKVASLELFQVEAVVLDGDAPPIVLLGNTFLSRVEMTRSGRAMILRKK